MVAGLGFCRCVRVFCGLKLVLFSCSCLVWFLGSVWGLWGIEIVPFLSQKG